MQKRSSQQLPVPPFIIALFVLIAVGLILGAVALAFAGSTRFQSGVQAQMLREAFRGVPPVSGSRLLYTDESQFENCGTALYFELYLTRAEAEAVDSHYARQFQQRGWVTDPRTGSTYLSETTQVDVVEPVPQAIGGVRIPQNIFAARQPDTTLYAVVVTGWRGDLCPNLNRSVRLRS
jgi:hypothetical protein